MIMSATSALRLCLHMQKHSLDGLLDQLAVSFLILHSSRVLTGSTRNKELEKNTTISGVAELAIVEGFSLVQLNYHSLEQCPGLESSRFAGEFQHNAGCHDATGR